MDIPFDKLKSYVKDHPFSVGLVGGGLGLTGLYMLNRPEPVETQPVMVISNKNSPPSIPSVDNVGVTQVKAIPIDEPVQTGNRLINLDPMSAEDLRRQIQYQERRLNSDIETLNRLREMYEEVSQ